MTPQSVFTRLYKPLLATAALIILIWGMNLASSVLTPLLLALVIAIVLAPGLFWLQGRGLSRGLALVVMILLTIGVLVVVGAIVVYSIADLITKLPEYEPILQSQINAISQRAAALGINLDNVLSNSNLQAPDLIGSIVSFLRNLLANLVVALVVLTVYVLFLLEANRVPGIIKQHLAGNSLLTTSDVFSQGLRAYFRNISVVYLVIGVLSAIILVLLRVPYPWLWGVASFVLHFVPVIGMWLALIPMVMMAFIANGPENALLVALAITVMDVVVSNTLYFRLVGSGLSLSPVVMFIALLFWTLVLGPLGALLALPLTLMLKEFILDRDAQTQVLSDILGATRVKKGSDSPA